MKRPDGLGFRALALRLSAIVLSWMQLIHGVRELFISFCRKSEKELVVNSPQSLIRLRQSSEQNIGNIKRVVGLMPARHMVELIDALDLDANPRNSKLGPVTEAIVRSIVQDEGAGENKLFPFKSKGILLAASGYTLLDRGRYVLEFNDLSTEGILDGGHNTLALGYYILDQAFAYAGMKPVKKSAVSIWENFKEFWIIHRGVVGKYIECIVSDPISLRDRQISLLDFLVPVELILPVDPDDGVCVDVFHSSLLEICEARNNNAQLTQGTKGNQQGLFDSFKGFFEERDRDFAKTISWKTNDGGKIQSRSLVALAWIPLSMTGWVNGSNKIMDAPSPVTIYSGKEKCLEKYLDLMRCNEITIETDGPRRELKDLQVASALKVAVDLPRLFDALYEMFPACYNKQGSYGKIGAVKSMMKKSGNYTSPYYGMAVDKPVPEGYIYPLTYGLKSAMCVDKQSGRIDWKTDPFDFIASSEFEQAVVQYCGVISQSDYDPQKVGKGAFSYTSAENAVKLALFDYLQG